MVKDNCNYIYMCEYIGHCSLYTPGHYHHHILNAKALRPRELLIVVLVQKRMIPKQFPHNQEHKTVQTFSAYNTIKSLFH